MNMVLNLRATYSAIKGRYCLLRGGINDLHILDRLRESFSQFHQGCRIVEGKPITPSNLKNPSSLKQSLM